MLENLLNVLADAAYGLPGVRAIMGLVNERWRPIWAAVWVLLLAHLVLRTLRAFGERRARLTMIRDAQAPGSEPVSPTIDGAIAARLPPEAVTAPVPRVLAAGVPPRVLMAILGIAAVVAVSDGLLMRPTRATAVEHPSAPDTATLKSASAIDAAPFAFRSRGSRVVDDDCVMTFEVTAGTAAPWTVTVDVMDTAGTVIARDAKRVPSLLPGVFTEFRFNHVDCDEIDSWQFQGETRRTP